jgi:hypothetical protein
MSSGVKTYPRPFRFMARSAAVEVLSIAL